MCSALDKESLRLLDDLIGYLRGGNGITVMMVVNGAYAKVRRYPLVTGAL